MKKTRSTALVVAAHPDDEILGCGGTIARLSSEGWQVHVAILAEGVNARGGNTAERDLAALRKSAEKAAAIVGEASLKLFDFPDNRMDSIDLLDVVKEIETLIARYKPSVVYTHHAGDVNVDHRTIALAVAAATRPLPGSGVVEVLSFEVPSSTDWVFHDDHAVFAPNVFVDISKQLSKKIRALQAYAGEMRPFPHSRSIENVTALAKVRGAQAGIRAAEAFHLNRKIVC